MNALYYHKINFHVINRIKGFKSCTSPMLTILVPEEMVITKLTNLIN